MTATASRNFFTLRELAQQVLDGGEFRMSATAGEEFCSESQMLYQLNTELAELHDLLIDVHQDYFVAEADITVDAVGNGDSALLPSDFQRLLKVYDNSTGSRIPLDKFSLEHPTTVFSYRILGERMVFSPAPVSGTIFTLLYAPRYQLRGSLEDRISISIPCTWTDYVVNGVIATLLAKEESDPSFFLGKKGAARDRIVGAATRRDSGRAGAIVDVTSRRDGIDTSEFDL